MVRTQMQLTDEQAKALKQIAGERGISMAELIRESVERTIKEAERKEKWRRATALVGRYHSGLHDVAEEHDKYLAEDFR